MASRCRFRRPSSSASRRRRARRGRAVRTATAQPASASPSPQLTPRVAAELELPRTERGLVITDVDPSGVAADAGLQPGDIVKKVNGQEVQSVADLRSALATRKDAPALVLVSRNGATVFVALPHA
jgi:serine protease Do